MTSIKISNLERKLGVVLKHLTSDSHATAKDLNLARFYRLNRRYHKLTGQYYNPVIAAEVKEEKGLLW